MGCSASKALKTEDITRCRARRRLMKQTVASRHQFAAAHAAYIQAMKNVGAAFRQFGETEARELTTTSAAAAGGAAASSVMKMNATMQSPERPLPPPPPPVFSPRVELLSPPASQQQQKQQREDDDVHQRSGNRKLDGDEDGRFRYEKSSEMIKQQQQQRQREEDEDEEEEVFYYMDEEKVGKEYYYTAPPPPPVPSSTAPPPPSPPRASAWDFLDPFRAPEPPVHLQEQRRLKKLQMMKREHEAADRAEEDREEDEEEDDEDDELENEDAVMMSRVTDCEKGGLEQFSKSSSVVGSSKRDHHLAIIVMPSGGIGHKELLEVVKEVDEQFLRAYDCGKNVSKLLEARKVHYHSNFVDSIGSESHSKRVLQAISLHRGGNKIPMALKVVASEDHLSSPDEAGTTGSHAATLDSLLAWEKKLYEEVKNTDKLCLEYKKKYLSSAKLQEEASESTKAFMKALATKIQVCLQGVDTAIAAINKLKEDELHSQLFLLIEGLMNMWNELYECHQRQYRIVAKMKSVDHWGAVDPTPNIHRLATTQLQSAVEAWYSGFNKLVFAQREYLHSLTGWLRLSNLPLEMESLRETEKQQQQQVMKQQPSWSSSILQLCQDWSLAMDRLPDKVASESIKSFVAVVHKLMDVQSEEVKHRKKVDSLSKEFDKKAARCSSSSSSLSSAKRSKNKLPDVVQVVKDEILTTESLNAAAAAAASNSAGDQAAEDNVAAMLMRGSAKSRVSEKLRSLNVVRERLEEEKEKVAKAVFNTRAVTINSLHTGLPSVFQTVAGFGRICLHAYQSLYCQAHNGALLRITHGEMN